MPGCIAFSCWFYMPIFAYHSCRIVLFEFVLYWSNLDITKGNLDLTNKLNKDKEIHHQSTQWTLISGPIGYHLTTIQCLGTKFGTSSEARGYQDNWYPCQDFPIHPCCITSGWQREVRKWSWRHIWVISVNGYLHMNTDIILKKGIQTVNWFAMIRTSNGSRLKCDRSILLELR